MTGDIVLPDVLQFMQVLWRLVHGVERTSKQMALDRGITGPQRLVVRMIGLSPGVSAGTLAATLHLHPSTVTGILRRLEHEGLIDRSTHDLDKRRAVLRLTTRGRRVNAIRNGTVEATVEAVLHSAAKHDRDGARNLLAAIADRLEHSTADRVHRT